MQDKYNKTLIIFAFIVIVLFSFTTDLISFKNIGTHSVYKLMSEKPFKMDASPYCYRVGVPLLAYAMPLDSGTAFQIILYLSAGLLILLSHLFLSSFKLDKKAVLVTLLVFISTFWTIRYFIFNPFEINNVAFVLLIACLFFMINKNNVLFSITLLLALFIKENALVLLPVYLTYKYQIYKRKSFLMMLKYALPPVLVYVLFRFISFKAYFGSDIIAHFNYFSGRLGFAGYFKLIVNNTVLIWGMLLPVILIDMKTLFSTIKKHLWTLVLFILSLLWPLLTPGSDLNFYYAYPAVLIWFAYSIQSIFQKHTNFSKLFVPIVIVFQIMVNYLIFPKSIIFSLPEYTGLAIYYVLIGFNIAALLIGFILLVKNRKTENLN